MEKVKEGGTIVLLSDVSSGYPIFDKNITVTSDADKTYTISVPTIYIVNSKTATFENMKLKNISFSVDGKVGEGVIFKNCTGSGISVPSGINNVTLDNSVLDGEFYPKEKLTLNNSTIDGKFSVKDFKLAGNCTFKQKANTVSQITGDITVNGTLTVVAAKVEKGAQIIQLPTDTDVAIASKFDLSDTQDGKYTLKVRTIIGNETTYLGVSERISSGNGKFAVAYEPVLAQPVKENLNYITSDISLGSFFIKSATWSGYTGNNNTWVLDDMPELTITLSTDSVDTSNHESGRRFGHFDETFSVDDLSVYSWNYEPEVPLTYTNKNNDVQIKIKAGQGISDDGMTFTFTICYPAVTRLEQTVTVDTSDRTINCGETLDAPDISAEGKISYESSVPGIASVDAITGKITAHKAGTVTITIKAAQTDLYKEAQVSYKLIVSHKYSDDFKHSDTEHWKECTCGDKSEKAEHTGGTATCKNLASCEKCGQSYGKLDAENHIGEKIWSTENSTQHEQIWDCCGKITVTLENHKWKDGVCKDCGYICVHTGKTADCIHKAKCEVCGTEYGEVNAENHLTLKHNEAKAATTEAEGNTEYWYCDECGKYFSDKNGKNEITLANTVIEKLLKPDNNYKSPQTGDSSRIWLWFALLFVSIGGLIGTTVYRKKKKYSVK